MLRHALQSHSMKLQQAIYSKRSAVNITVWIAWKITSLRIDRMSK